MVTQNKCFLGLLLSCKFWPEPSCFLPRVEVKASKPHASHRYGAEQTKMEKNSRMAHKQSHAK